MAQPVPNLNPKFIVDENGKKTAAILDMRSYRALIRYLEDQEDLALLDDLAERGPHCRPYVQFRAELISAGLL
jgi:hypothetical protein